MERIKQGILSLFFVVVLVLGWVDLAWGQSPAAEALFEQGKVAMAAGDFDTACARFRGSDAIDPQPGTRLNLAACEEKRGHLASAWEAFSAALPKLPKDDPRVAKVREHLAAIELRLPRLVLVLAPDASRGTTVREGTVVLGTADTYGVPLPLDPGVHHLTVIIPDSAPKTVDVTLVEGDTAKLTVGAVHRREEGGAPLMLPASSPFARKAPWILGGVGLASFAIAGVTGGLLLHDKAVANAHCTTSGPVPACKDQTGMDAAAGVRTLGPATTAMLILGSTGVASSAVWLGLRAGMGMSDGEDRREIKGLKGLKVGVVPMGAGVAWRVEGSW
jgi:hypothetical protein